MPSIVTLILPVKNGARTLPDVLDAVGGQRSAFELRILAVDSGSTDGTLEILSRHPVQVVQIPPEDFNHGGTRNLAASQADPTSKYLVYLSQDALPADEHWLANLLAPMEADPQVAGVFSRHVPRPGASPALVRQLTTMWQTGGTERLVKSMPADPAEYEARKDYYTYFSNTSSAVRRSVWEAIPFRELDFAEDADWADRALRAGYKLVFEPASVVVHSHDYGIIEQFRQNVDHTEAMKALFDPPHFHRPRRLLLQLASVPREALRDWRFMRAEARYRDSTVAQRLRWSLRSPCWHAASVLGGWTGAYLHKLPRFLRFHLGRQRRIQRGIENR